MNPFENFGSKLIGWYEAHKRDLPWRKTTDPYAIWLSEVILQQTRVAQGLPYYEKFIEHYPTVQALASAPTDDVLRLWQGLGYYFRARNLHQTAQLVVQAHNGLFPGSYKALLELKGIGPYTAAAVASFAYNENVAVLDGNVFRMLARLTGNHTDIASSAAKKIFTQMATNLLPIGQANVFNQAMMEFGAVQCTPQKPNCLFCPFSDICYANLNSKQAELPVKSKKISIKHRFFSYLVIQQQGQVLMRKRTTGDIWEGLHDFYLIETTERIALKDQADSLLNICLQHGFLTTQTPFFKHILTHQKIEAEFLIIQLSNNFSLTLPEPYRWYDFSEVEAVGKPVLIDNFIKKYQLFLD